MAKTKIKLPSSDERRDEARSCLQPLRARLNEMSVPELQNVADQSGISLATLYRVRSTTGRLPRFEVLFKIVSTVKGTIEIRV